MALGLEERESRPYVDAMKSSDDQITMNPVAIGDMFKGFCTDLCGAETGFDGPVCGQCLDELGLPRISQMDKESLGAPLGLEELHISLGNLRGADCRV